MEFIGHGALGLNHPPAWASYFAVMGISKGNALALMPFVGAVDITMALAVLYYPVRGVILYMTAWGLLTALLRPMAGESLWEAVERAGNFGAPFALFFMAGADNRKSWLRFEQVEALEGKLRLRVSWVLRLTTTAMLAGHGALGLLVRKPLFSMQYSQIGLHGAWIEPLVGGLELMLALAVLFRPECWVLIFVLAWKLATESLSPLAGSSIWVFVEHGGSYAAPLALAVMGERRDEAGEQNFELSSAEKVHSISTYSSATC